MLGIKEGEIHYFRSRSFCLTLPKIFVGETFCAVFQKISGFDEIYGEEGGGYQDFPLERFCLKVPKNFVGDPVFVPQSFRYRKNLWIRGTGGVSGFSVDTFLSHKAEKFHRGNSL